MPASRKQHAGTLFVLSDTGRPPAVLATLRMRVRADRQTRQVPPSLNTVELPDWRRTRSTEESATCGARRENGLAAAAAIEVSWK